MDRNRSASEAFIPTTYARRHEDDVQVSVADLPTPRPNFKADKTCVLCGQSFGKVLNLVHAKRYCCSFCYRGVCAKCSPYTLKHPETRQSERCCNSCYNKFVTQEIRSQMQDDLNEQRSKVKQLRSKVDEERQAEMAASVEIEELQKELQLLKSESELQTTRNEQTLKQLNEEEAVLKQRLESLRAEKVTREEKEKRAREQAARNQEEAANLRRLQESDQKKANELQIRKAQLDTDLENVRKQLQDPVTLPSEEASTEKNKRVVELQQGLALERELLVKLQQENLALTQAKSEKPTRTSPKEQELGEVPTHEARDLEAKVAALQEENSRLEKELHDLKSETPGEDSEMERLKTAVAKEKEENTRLMLQLQDHLLNPSSSEPLTRDKCHCCAF